ncbi:Ig-like domain-containing protein [Cellulomonas denverensis]|uniref:Ig-like domain-containing protein n=1 Tax=Cellulomonas denverensis TaxID=264297 RepID=UPI0035E74659
MRRLSSLCTAATLLAALTVVGAAPAQAAPTDRITTTIANWGTTDTLGYVRVNSATATIREFTVPAVGTTGPVEYTISTGEVYCVAAEQGSSAAVVVYWRPAATNACQNITTVAEVGSNRIGFMAADGPYQGNYLGDASQGGIVDWAQEGFFGVEAPQLIAQIDLTDPTGLVLTRQPEIRGTGHPGAQVVVTRDADGATVGQAEVATDGTWAFSPQIAFDWGEQVALTATQTVTGDPAPTTDQGTFRVADPVTIAAGTPDATARSVQVSGTADPESEVTVTDAAGATVGSATVNPDGTWGPVLVTGLILGDNPLTATERVDGTQVPEVGTAHDGARGLVRPDPGRAHRPGTDRTGPGRPGRPRQHPAATQPATPVASASTPDRIATTGDSATRGCCSPPGSRWWPAWCWSPPAGSSPVGADGRGPRTRARTAWRCGPSSPWAHLFARAPPRGTPARATPSGPRPGGSGAVSSGDAGRLPTYLPGARLCGG